jgi:nucleoside-diphosphate-sugar epimerase
MEAYILAKIAEIYNTEEFIKTQKPHFSLSYIMPGHVFGRNELITKADMMFGQNSSNNFLMPGMIGGELPFPIHGAFVHVDDLADIHLRVVMLDSSAPRDFGIARTVDYSTIFDHVEKAFPEAVAAGVFKRGAVPVLPVNYSSTEMEELLGRELKSFEEAVVDVAGQYLENLGWDIA